MTDRPTRPTRPDRRRVVAAGTALTTIGRPSIGPQPTAPIMLADEGLLPTKRSTRVAEILRCGAARPRTVATLSDAGLIAAKKRSLEVFQREVRR